MHLEQLREYCIAKKAVTEEFPFNQDTLVFKVMGKMYVMIALDRWEKGETPIVLKCNPERVLELSELYESIFAGLQQGRSEDAKYVHAKHWITIHVNQEISDREVFEYIDECYDLIVSKFPKKLKEAYANL